MGGRCGLNPVHITLNANRYAYAGGDPINNFDPTGLFWEELAGAAVGGLVGALFAVPAGLLVPGVGATVGAIIGGCLGGAVGSLVTDELKKEGPDLGAATANCIVGAIGGVGIAQSIVSKFSPRFNP